MYSSVTGETGGKSATRSSENLEPQTVASLASTSRLPFADSLGNMGAVSIE